MPTPSLSTLIALHSNDSLALHEGSVYQVWEDGEITLQKSGSLLGQRTLHCLEEGAPAKARPLTEFPHRTCNGHAFAYCTREGAEAIRAAILSTSPSSEVRP